MLPASLRSRIRGVGRRLIDRRRDYERAAFDDDGCYFDDLVETAIRRSARST